MLIVSKEKQKIQKSSIQKSSWYQRLFQPKSVSNLFFFGQKSVRKFHFAAALSSSPLYPPSLLIPAEISLPFRRCSFQQPHISLRCSFRPTLLRSSLGVRSLRRQSTVLVSPPLFFIFFFAAVASLSQLLIPAAPWNWQWFFQLPDYNIIPDLFELQLLPLIYLSYGFCP
ncbi:hypothetical protein ACOSP7_010201 [Xanthoceras sorbifolium]